MKMLSLVVMIAGLLGLSLITGETQAKDNSVMGQSASIVNIDVPLNKGNGDCDRECDGSGNGNGDCDRKRDGSGNGKGKGKGKGIGMVAA